MWSLSDIRAAVWKRRESADAATLRLLRFDGHDQGVADADGLVPLRFRSLRSGPVMIRPGTARGSDVNTVWEVFFSGCYRPPSNVGGRPGVVLDVGANIGLFGLYLLSRGVRPRRYIAIEPDADNLRVLRRNLATLESAGVEVEIVEAAAGGANGTARFDADAASVFRQVSDRGSVEVRQVSIPSVLAEAGVDAVDLVKMDIEGGEASALPAEGGRWLGRVGALLIELHNGLDGAWLSGVVGPHGLRARGPVSRRSPDNYVAVRSRPSTSRSATARPSKGA